MKELFSTLLRRGFGEKKKKGKVREREQEKENGRGERERERISSWSRQLNYFSFDVCFI